MERILNDMEDHMDMTRDLNVRVCGRGVTVTPAMRRRVEEGLERSVSVMDIQVTSCEVVLRVDTGHSESTRCHCEVTLVVPKATVRVSEPGSDMYDAIDAACDKVSRQLRRYKTKVISQGRRPRRHESRRRREEPFLGDVSHLAPAGEDDDMLVRHKSVELEPMTEDEALLRIDMLGHDFFLFANAEDGRPSVIYRRVDGGYGVIVGIELSEGMR